MASKFTPAQPQIVSIGRKSIANTDRTVLSAGGWLSGPPRGVQDARERLGYSQAAQTSSLYESPESHYSFYRSYRSLMPSQYWSLYKSSPDVRVCVDSIVRRIATRDWIIKPTTDPRETDEYKRLSAKSAEVAQFLRVPNKDGQTWQELMTAMVTDLLVYDSGILEMVEDGEGNLTEVVSWLGSEWFEVIDTHGNLVRYDQTPENSNEPPVEVSPEKICAFKLFTNNRSTNGLPILESVITECLTVLLSSEHAMLALDANEIPPGLLVLGGVAGAAAERVRADLQQMKGRDHRIRVVTSPEPNGIEAKWVELRHNIKDLEMLRVIDTMRKTIWRVFGVSPTELGETMNLARAAAEVQMDVSSSHLISPILETIQARVNAQILPRLLGEDAGKITFAFERGAVASAKERLQIAERSEILLRRGVMTVNEVRDELGLLPIEGGDIATVETNLGPVPLETLVVGIADSDEVQSAPQTEDQGSDASFEELSKLGDLSKAVQKNLRERAKKHNEKMKGRAAWRRTNAGTLAKVFDRGVGAYHNNPQSVRPGVASAEQWGYGRVDSFLHVLDKDKFRKGKHDTDLLPKQHPLSSKGEERGVVSRAPSFDRADLNTAWGWNDRQRDRLLGDPSDWRRYARAHLWNDGSGDERFGAYKFPIARVVKANDEDPKIVFRGVASVIGALNEDGKHESLTGVTLEEQRQVYARVASLYDDFGQEVPVVARLEDDRALRAVGDVDPTNFPASGDDKAVSLANSQWEIFDHKYAKKLKDEYPEIWKKGGNIRGNSQWRKLLPIVERGGSMKPKNDTEEGAIRLREAWNARHFKDHRIAGVIAQVKWLAVGSRGEVYMKKLIDEEKKKIDDKRSKHHHHDHDCEEHGCFGGRETSIPDARQRLRGMHPASRLIEIERAAAQTYLPSEWQPSSKFASVRTLDLSSLADEIAAYTRTAARLYADAAGDIESSIRAAYDASGKLSVQNAASVQRQIDDRLNALAAKWDAIGREYYRSAAQNGARSAEKMSGTSSVSALSVDATAGAYANEAMSYLTDQQGLVGTLREQLRRLVNNASAPKQVRSVDRDIDDIDNDSERSEVLATTGAVFAANAHRVSNWTGKLVGLANRMLAETLESVVSIGDGKATVWYYEWVSAGGRSCPICAEEGVQGFRRLDRIGRYPGEDTYCGANCRCVLVLWTEDEVRSGAAESLSTPAGEVSSNPMETNYLPPGMI